MPYPLLLSPLTVGPVRARNRVVFGAHFTMYSEPAREWGEPGHFGERQGRYLAERARGGAGIVIAGQVQVHPTSAYQMANNAIAWDEESVDHFNALTSQVHEHGALAFVQLAHNGGVNTGSWSKLAALAPSDVANHNEAPKQLERHEIRELVDAFARSAANAARGGFDGIEVHGAHGYLIHEFLSPRSNKRTDEYGGSFENRLRFAVEVLTAVRAAVGPNVAVGLRLVGDEERGSGGGLTAEDAARIATYLEGMRLVDFLNVSIGLSGVGMVRPMYAPPGLGVYAAEHVKRAVSSTPVFAVHRILMPEQAEQILAAGQADAVTVVRALIADPEWVAKAVADSTDTIRRCTGCNQGCYGNLLQSLPVTCVTNPVVGRERSLGDGTWQPAAVRKHVVVVGGGPGGLEAAWVSAARGHRVTLLERARELGGAIRLAQRLPGREELRDFADWRIAECERRHVTVLLEHDATVDSVIALRPDAVIVATGGRMTKQGSAKWHPMPIRGTDRAFVIDHVQALAALAEHAGAERRVVVLDAVGHIEGIGIAELFARNGSRTTLISPLPSPICLDAETQAVALPRAVRAGVEWRPSTVVAEIGDHEVTVVDVLSGRPAKISEVDTVVVRAHGLPNDELYFALRERVDTVVRIGDAVAVRPADRAIFDGHIAGRTI